VHGRDLMKAVISGGGIGGLAAALALARAGWTVEVFEQADQLAEVGAGLQLSPNAMKALRSLGVEKEVAAVASAPQALELRLGVSGRKIFSIPVGQVAVERYGAPYLHVHRADLLEVLRVAAVGGAGVKLRLGARVSAHAEAQNSVRVGIDNGHIVEADLLVGADGIRSAVRRLTFGETEARFTGCVAWRFVAPMELAGPVAAERKATVWAGPGRHAVTYPVRRGELLNFVGVVEASGWDREGWSEPGDPSELAAAFAGWAEPVAAAIRAASLCWRWALFDREPMPQWSTARTTLLGDACHPMPPFQAQGAAMAIEDAVVLANRLRTGSIPEALVSYEAVRRPRTARVLASARANMRIFHRSGAAARLATYAPMRAADLMLPGFVRSRQDWIYGYDAATA
jgi:salicylate hydroxylase